MDYSWSQLAANAWTFLKEDVWWTFLNGFCLTLTLPIILVLLFGILLNQIGGGFGLPLLLWVDKTSIRGKIRQFAIGLGVGVLVWQVFLAGYLSEEFASSYTIDHPPFCEARYEQLDQASGDGVYAHRFRHEPTHVRSFLLYVASLAKSVLFLSVFLWLLIRLFGLIGSGRGGPFASTWEPYTGRAHEESRRVTTRILRTLLQVLFGVVDETLGKRPRPPFSLWLPAGAVSMTVAMALVSSFFLTGGGQVVTRQVGSWCVASGGWGYQAARQAKLTSWNDLQKAHQDADQNLDLETKARADQAQASTRQWLMPYYPLFGLFVLTFVTVFLYTVSIASLRKFLPLLTPAGWILFFLHVPVFTAVFLSYFVPFSGQLFQIMLLIGILTAGRTYKLRYPNLPFGDEPVSLKDSYAEMALQETPNTAKGVVQESPYGLIRSATIAPRREGAGSNAAKPPIALVCVSGGGSRASYWTMNVLAQLEKTFLGHGPAQTAGHVSSPYPPIAFPYHIRLVTGASGGMLAASAYTASLEAPSSGEIGGSINRFSTSDNSNAAIELDKLIEASGANFLDAPVHLLGSHDLWWLFLPKRLKYDRGTAIEDSWRQHFGGVLNRSFAELREGEQEGWRPSLIFSPMLVEDGRQLFISNIDLQSVTRNLAYVPGEPPDTKDHGKTLLSREGLEFFKLFPDAAQKFEVGTAARMSASFPYILPAGILPTNPPRRVVDAGYYDNYGVGIAASWLVNHMDWVKENTSGVVIIQIRDGASEESRRREVVDDAFPSLPSRSLQWALSPPAGLWQSRVASNVFRNDNLIHTLNEIFRLNGFDPEFLATATFELSQGEDVSLSWTLTPSERDWVKDGLHSPEITERVDDVVTWWHRRLAFDAARTKATAALSDYAS